MNPARSLLHRSPLEFTDGRVITFIVVGVEIPKFVSMNHKFP
jgi:hypothetical protein